MFRNSPKTLSHKDNLVKELTKLKQEEIELDTQIKHLENYNKQDPKEQRMTALHDYNDIKDATQIVLGALATLEGVTVTEIHNRFDLPLYDKDG